MSSQRPISLKNDLKKKGKSKYHKPKLEDLGDLRTMTLGGSPGGGDSGAAGGSQNPFGLRPFPNGYPQPGDPNWPY